MSRKLLKILLTSKVYRFVLYIFLMKFLIPMFVRLSIALLAFATIAFADFAQKDRHKHSISAQVGVSGVSEYPSTFGLQFPPFDASYAYKFFDNNRYSISNATFYDNIGVEIDGMNFNLPPWSKGRFWN